MTKEQSAMQDLLTAEELANKLKVPLSWIYDRTRQSGPEKLPHYKLGKYLRFSEDEIIGYLRIRSVSLDELTA